ncbi:hypothetical protein KKG46_04180 [Patescibacteria group bacterium]|nr:hypothetical protein [Patescibacteria group bacterium]
MDNRIGIPVSGSAKRQLISDDDIGMIVADPEKIIYQLSENVTEIFSTIIQRIPRDLSTLLSIAWFSKNKICLMMLIEHAHTSNRVDDLIFAFIPALQDWMYRPFFYEVFNDLLYQARAQTMVHILRAANPRKRSWLARLINVDTLWETAIKKMITQRELRCAYECLLEAGTGFLQSPRDSAMAHMTPCQRSFLLDVQTWQDSDAFFPTYSRMSNITDLIRLVWEAHRKVAELDSFGPDECVGISSYRLAIGHRKQDGSLVVTHQDCPMPYRGLIARFAEPPVHTESLPGLLFVRAPTLQHTTLCVEGAMLQQLVMHYLVMVVSVDDHNRRLMSESG